MLLDELTLEERYAIEEISTIKRYSAGDEVIREGEEGKSVYFIMAGQVEVKKQLGDGREKVLKTLGEQEFFGEMSFFDNAPRSADVVAGPGCQIMELPMQQFQAMIHEHPGIGLKVYRYIAKELVERLRAIDEELKKTLQWAIEGWTYGV